MNHPVPLVRLPGVHLGIIGFEKTHLSYDVLHTCDLGVSAVIAGSILSGLADAEHIFQSGVREARFSRSVERHAVRALRARAGGRTGGGLAVWQLAQRADGLRAHGRLPQLTDDEAGG